MRASSLPPELEVEPSRVPADSHLVLRGGSAIIGPDGDYLVPPLWDRPGVLVAEVDLERVRRESMTLDVAGHYSRPDCLSMTVHRSRRSVADAPVTPPTRPNEVPA